MVPDPDAEYHLFDRVVNVRESFSVPLGLRGTVIGIKGGEWTTHTHAHICHQHTRIPATHTHTHVTHTDHPLQTVSKVLLCTAEREAEVLYEVMFDEEFAGGLTIR